MSEHADYVQDVIDRALTHYRKRMAKGWRPDYHDNGQREWRTAGHGVLRTRIIAQEHYEMLIEDEHPGHEWHGIGSVPLQ